MHTRHATPLQGMESLENRALLAADVMALPEPAAAETAQDPIIITAVHLEVDDQPVSVTRRNEVVLFKPGQRLEVVGLDYEVAAADGQAEAHAGVLAFEGYLRLAKGGKGLGEFDYDDGRFATVDRAIETGSFQQVGLQGDAWELSDDSNRLALALVRYTEDGLQVEDRFHVNLQFSVVDLGFLGAEYQQKGDHVKFEATVANKGDQVTTYAEIDVYRADDLTTPIWVGTYVGNFKAGYVTSIKFANSEKDGPFDKYWQPQESGTYVIRMYLDPENGIAERSEENNFLEGKLEIAVDSRAK